MRFLPLTRGLCALVDEEDLERLSRYNWQVLPCKSNIYAGRVRRVSEGPGPERVLLHYEVLRMRNPLPDGFMIDHADRYGLNCQKKNLRICTASENGANRGPNRGVKGRAKSSKYKGVVYIKAHGYYKEGWTATIRCRGEKYYLGFFTEERAAVEAYNAAAYRLFGEFAYLNLWEGPTRHE